MILMSKKIFSIGLMTFLGLMRLLAGILTPMETVSIATDKDAYIAGDWVYFSIKLKPQGNRVSDFVYLTVCSKNQQQIFRGCLKINNNTASGSFFLTDTLTTGIYQLVSYTNQMRNYGQEAYAVKNILIANRFDTDLKKIIAESVADTVIADITFQKGIVNNPFQHVKLNKEVFLQRELVQLDIGLTNDISGAVVSVSVRKAAPVNFPEGKNQEYTNPVNSCYFLPERSGYILEGHILNKNQTGAAKKMVFLSCEDSVANLQYARTNNNGEFLFFLNPYYFEKKIMVRMEGEDKSAMDIESKYFNGIIGTLPMQITGDLEGYLQTDQRYLRIQQSYNEIYHQEQPVTTVVKGWRPEVYSREGLVVRPSDYLYLPDFREISRELLMYYQIREKKNDFEGALFDINQREYVVPYIFFDGILLEHIRQIIHHDSKGIKSILTIPNARFLGDLRMPGILDITSNSAEIDSLQWRSPIAMLNVERPMPNSFYQVPEIDKMPRQIPAFLPLLYWNPCLTLDSGKSKTVVFYTSDCTGTFEVAIKGFSSDGEEIDFRKLFKVTSAKL